LVVNSLRNKGNKLREIEASDTLATNFGESGIFIFDIIVSSNSDALSPNALITRGLTPLSTVIDVFARIFWFGSNSMAPALINSSSTARVGIPRPYRFASASKVEPRPYNFKSAGCPFEPVNFGSSYHAASILFVDCSGASTG
jgi:hypothetical protein